MNNKCISCGKTLEVDSHSHTENANIIPNIWDGVVFRSSGQFGSRVIDEVGPNPEEIQVIVCDQCLIEKLDLVDLIKDKKTVRTSNYGKLEERLGTDRKNRIIELIKKDGGWTNKDSPEI